MLSYGRKLEAAMLYNINFRVRMRCMGNWPKNR